MSPSPGNAHRDSAGTSTEYRKRWGKGVDQGQVFDLYAAGVTNEGRTVEGEEAGGGYEFVLKQ